MLINSKPYNSQHLMDFHLNHYAATAQNNGILDQVTAGMPQIKQAIVANHIKPHAQVMKSSFPDHPMTTALDSADTPITPLKAAAPITEPKQATPMQAPTKA